MPGTMVLLILGASIVERIVAPASVYLDSIQTEPAIWQICIAFFFLVFLILPFISPLLLIFRGERKYLHWLLIASMAIAAGIALFGGFNSYPLQISSNLWGLWLYAGVAMLALTVEVLALVFGKGIKVKRYLVT